jgi:hypothetical protein
MIMCCLFMYCYKYELWSFFFLSWQINVNYDAK